MTTYVNPSQAVDPATEQAKQVLRNMMAQDNPDGPPIPGTRDPRLINFSYYVTVYSINKGLVNGTEAGLQKILTLQALLNNVSSDVTAIVTALNNLKALNPTTCTQDDINKCMTALATNMQKLFGPGATWES